jgi:hypothetical protein
MTNKAKIERVIFFATGVHGRTASPDGQMLFPQTHDSTLVTDTVPSLCDPPLLLISIRLSGCQEWIIRL